jgi:hypothetical protein
VINVDNIKSESLCSSIVEISEGYRKQYFSTGLIGFPPKPCNGILEGATCAGSGSSSRRFSRTKCLPNFHCLLGLFQ